MSQALKNIRFDFALASAYPKPFCTSVRISPIKLSTITIASALALQGADSLGTSAAYVVVIKMLMVDKMSSMIYELYIDFFSHLAKDISEGVSIYGEFCRKYNVKILAILKTYEKDVIVGSHIQPLPTKELRSVINILKTNPRIEFNIQT